MSLTKLSLVFLMLFSLSFAALAQKDEEEAQMFGSKRSLDVNVHNFGTLASDAKMEHQFKVLNSMKTDISIEATTYPKGISVTIVKKTAKQGEAALFTVTVNATALKGDFEENIIVNSVYQNSGVELKRKNIFVVKGSIK